MAATERKKSDARLLPVMWVAGPSATYGWEGEARKSRGCGGGGSRGTDDGLREWGLQTESEKGG